MASIEIKVVFPQKIWKDFSNVPPFGDMPPGGFTLDPDTTSCWNIAAKAIVPAMNLLVEKNIIDAATRDRTAYARGFARLDNGDYAMMIKIEKKKLTRVQLKMLEQGIKMELGKLGGRVIGQTFDPPAM